jgi:hypothetical protein
LERVGVRRLKSISYISLIPTFSLWRRSNSTCVDTYGIRGCENINQSKQIFMTTYHITGVSKLQEGQLVRKFE